MSDSISATVGRFGVKRWTDVAEVQQLLNNVPIAQGGLVIPIPINGFCGEQTKAAIKSFQVFHFGLNETDGRVDPKSASYKLLAQFRCPTRETRPEAAVTEFVIRPASQNRFYEVKPASGSSATALYWIGIPPVAAEPFLWFEGRAIPFRAPGDHRDNLECRATHTTRAAQGRLSSELVLNLPSGPIRIPMSAHLNTPSHTGVATLAGVFQKVA